MWFRSEENAITMKRIVGLALSTLAWLMGAAVVCGALMYATFVVMWLHAPIPKVLMVTLPIMLVLLGLARLLNIAGRKMSTCRYRDPP